MKKTSLLLLLLGAVGCDPNVVDAVREPPPIVVPDPDPGPESSLVHRYSFNGVGSVAEDSTVAAHGTIVNAELAGTGSLTLEGAHTLQYVDLPDHIIQNLDEATFEAWLTWSGTGGAWQRIFDFGNSSGGEDMPTIIPGTTGGTYSGTSYLFLTTNAVPDSALGLDSHIRVAYAHTGVNDEEICYGTETFPKNVPTHVALVIESSAEKMALYQNGALLSRCALTRPLADIDDLNNWLGRSNFTADPDLAAHYDEFRIYRTALTAQQIADSYKFGPDAEP